jgi:hypothetical protein
MKKFLLLTLIFVAIISTAANAQPQTQPQAQTMDPAAMLQQVKEKVRPEMVAKTGLTERRQIRLSSSILRCAWQLRTYVILVKLTVLQKFRN